ncbi:unnamed protein product [Camellia sinensis]
MFKLLVFCETITMGNIQFFALPLFLLHRFCTSVCLCIALILRYSLFLRIPYCRTQHGGTCMEKGAKIPTNKEAKLPCFSSLYCGTFLLILLYLSMYFINFKHLLDLLLPFTNYHKIHALKKWVYCKLYLIGMKYNDDASNYFSFCRQAADNRVQTHCFFLKRLQKQDIF